MKNIHVFSFVILSLLAIPQASHAEDSAMAAPAKGFRSTELPLPRFASLKSDKIYVRTGPAQSYPLRWVYSRAHMPVEIVQEFETWRKIRDIDGDEGWVHQTLLSGSRTAIVREDRDSADAIRMYDKDKADSRLVAKLEPGVVASLDKCGPAWCRLEAGGFKGWVQRNRLWGIYESEELN